MLIARTNVMPLDFYALEFLKKILNVPKKKEIIVNLCQLVLNNFCKTLQF